MVAVGAVIQDTDYNNIRDDIIGVLGTPSGTQGNSSSNQGYGQPLESNSVAAGATVTADDLNRLYLDIYTCRLHQVNGTGFAVQEVSTGNVIGADASGTDVDTLTLLQQGFNDYAAEATNSVNGRNTHSASYLAADTATNKQRTTAWGYGGFNTIDHYLTVTFAGQTKSSASGNSLALTAANHARAFFNTGGEIRLFATRTGGAGHTKNTDWTNMLATYINTISMSGSTSSVNGDGLGVSNNTIGFYDLTTSEQVVVSAVGSTYAANTYTLRAKVDNATNPTAITFRITLTDGDDQFASVDPSVDGTLTSNIQVYRAQDGNNIIEIDAPSVNTNATGTTL